MDLKEIRVEQTLHGYRDGHQLISSSIDVTAEQQWQMLAMSDLSGPAFQPGFSSYLTGYPLVDGGYYCFARTWSAPEMPRPGCVWTHTFLIPIVELGSIANFGAIAQSFRRPRGFDEADYAKAVHVALEGATELGINRVAAARILNELYGAGTSPVSLGAENASDLEDTVIAILNQQWPRLRRSFSFCTGALGQRLDYDLAIVPGANEPVLGEVTGAANRWRDVALDDLNCSSDERSDLRRFLWLYGPDFEAGRAAFRPLTEVWLEIGEGRFQFRAAFELVARSFPDPPIASRLKRDLFGFSGRLSRAIGEDQVLPELISSSGLSCMSVEDLAVRRRVRLLWEADRTKAFHLVDRAGVPTSAVKAAILKETGSFLIERSEFIPHIPTQTLLSVLKAVPQLLHVKAVWTRPLADQLQFVSLFAELDEGSEAIEGLTYAALREGHWSLVGDLARRFPKSTSQGLHEWIETSSEPLVVNREIERIVKESDWRAASTKLGPRMLALFSAVLGPSDRLVKAIPIEQWSAATRAATFDGQDAALKSCVFFLYLGLTNSDPSASNLIATSFCRVYDQAKFGKLPDDLWASVERVLPWIWTSWDRCLRLLKGVVRSFVENRWSVGQFWATFQTEEQKERAIEELEKTLEGRQYLKRALRSIGRGAVSKKLGNAKAKAPRRPG